MLLFAIQFILHGVLAFPAAQNAAASCAHDELYTSLSRDGGEFCSSMVKTPCEVSSTPTQFASYSSAKLSSYVSVPYLWPDVKQQLTYLIVRVHCNGL